MEESCFILAKAISMLIKSSTKEDMGIKDHRLMKMVTDILQEDFISTSEFDDVVSDEQMKVKK